MIAVAAPVRGWHWLCLFHSLFYHLENDRSGFDTLLFIIIIKLAKNNSFVRHFIENTNVSTHTWTNWILFFITSQTFKRFLTFFN